ncbi:MAG: hypothetical protein A2X46_15925 [Lentisphaerae bacterium GWF2_57_35]|nr:MAG: hypothetical protein A2X46_15925 [Lentisphaerae bacterium GWF2_57_35]
MQRNYADRVTLFKKDVIDYAFSALSIKKVAELGCIWGVDGAYGQYIHDKYAPTEVVMVDAIWNENALRLCRERKNITTVDGNFCDVSMPQRIGKVDAIIFFDILLHMVSPNWDEMLRMYADYTNAFLIVNPQFMATSTTVRLLDLGVDEYFRNIPHAPDYPIYQTVFADPYQMDAKQNKPLRDAFYIWQWGITNHDLIDKMDRMGFEPVLIQKDKLYYGKAKNFANYGFIFARSRK